MDVQEYFCPSVIALRAAIWVKVDFEVGKAGDKLFPEESSKSRTLLLLCSRCVASSENINHHH